MNRVLFLCVLLLFPACANATRGVCQFPKTSMTFAADSHTGITEKEFNESLDIVVEKWESTVRANGGILKFRRLWSDPTLNSDTTVAEDGKTWVINSYGGLARHPLMTKDAYTLIACHELGHHLGGAPLYPGEEWASDEGASDYFATLQCARSVFGTDEKAVARTKKASKVLAHVLYDLGGGGDNPPLFSTPDRKEVMRTSHGHPAAQCRLDTYLAGTLCEREYTPLSKTDPTVGSCHEYTPHAGVGSRPRCWFKP